MRELGGIYIGSIQTLGSQFLLETDKKLQHPDIREGGVTNFFILDYVEGGGVIPSFLTLFYTDFFEISCHGGGGALSNP